MVTVNEVCAYIGIDYVDDMVTTNVNRIIKTADAYLRGSVGENYPADDPRAVEMALIICADLYENRTFKDTISGNVRKLIDDMSTQLRVELRRGSV